MIIAESVRQGHSLGIVIREAVLALVVEADETGSAEIVVTRSNSFGTDAA